MDMTPASRLAYAPILLGVAFIATLFIVAESGYKRIHEAGQMISAAEPGAKARRLCLRRL